MEKHRIKFVTISGNVADIEIEQLLEVDGKEYIPPEDNAAELKGIRESLIYLDGKVEALTAIVCKGEHINGSN